jgi:hypothetical protein
MHFLAIAKLRSVRSAFLACALVATGTANQGSPTVLSNAELSAQARAKNPAGKGAIRKGSRYETYQVPAGTHLSLELRTALNSNSSRPRDEVRGKLRQALTVEGIELVPAGAAVIGTVQETAPAGLKARGFITFEFHVIEHPDTKSLATIRTTALTFHSEPGEKKKTFKEVQLDPGADLEVSLLAPLKVHIPRS